jgi:hypothetical protein
MEEKTLRTRQAPKAIEELLAIANKLPRKPSQREVERASQDFPNTKKPSHTLSDMHIHDNIVNAHKYGYSEQWTRLFLEEAVKRLPGELQAFVTQDLEIKQGEDGTFYQPPLDERWQQDGPHLWDYANLVHLPFHLGSQVESMRQRYLFLFAVRDILRCIARPDVVDSDTQAAWATAGVPPVMSDPQRWLEVAWRSLMHPARLHNKVDSLRSQIYIRREKTREGTHKFGVYKPLFFRVLEEVEVERIRECPICEKLFWAGRLDQAACSPRCSNVDRKSVV